MYTIAACQPPDIHEDVEQTLGIIQTYAAKAEAQGATLLCFPECYLQGYIVTETDTPRLAIDLSSHTFEAILERLAHVQPALIIGLIERSADKIYNTAVVIKQGKLLGCYRKTRLLPGEQRVFTPGSDCPVFEVDGFKFGINICYELTFSECAQAVAEQGVNWLVCPCNNMMRRENAEIWKYKHNSIRAKRTIETGLWLISSDVTGESERRIAYGPTAVINPQGEVVKQVPLLTTGMVLQVTQ